MAAETDDAKLTKLLVDEPPKPENSRKSELEDSREENNISYQEAVYEEEKQIVSHEAIKGNCHIFFNLRISGVQILYYRTWRTLVFLLILIGPV